MADEREGNFGKEAPEGVVQLLEQGAAVQRANAWSLEQLKVTKARNEQKILQDSLAELELVPEQAAKAFYSIPYTDNRTRRVTMVEGLSIGAAVSLARRWGNCTTAARILKEDAEGWEVEGLFVDLETSFWVGRPKTGTKYEVSREGRKYLLPERRQVMALGALISKAQRDAILAGLPMYLRLAYFEKAKQLAGGSPNVQADMKKVDAVLVAFARFKATAEELEGYVGRIDELWDEGPKPRNKWTGEDVARLRGLWVAVSEGSITIEDALRPKDEPTPVKPSPEVVTPDSLAGGQASASEVDKRPDSDPAGGEPARGKDRKSVV